MRWEGGCGGGPTRRTNCERELGRRAGIERKGNGTGGKLAMDGSQDCRPCSRSEKEGAKIFLTQHALQFPE
jgi:hypothetical protein